MTPIPVDKGMQNGELADSSGHHTEGHEVVCLVKAEVNNLFVLQLKDFYSVLHGCANVFLKELVIFLKSDGIGSCRSHSSLQLQLGKR